MKVLLRKGHHSVYDDLVRHPPEGIEYVLPRFAIQSRSRLIDALKKRLYRAYLHTFNKPHLISVNPRHADLIHGCSGLLIANRFPWVLDIEHVASFVGFEAGRLDDVRPQIEALLCSDYCRKIMPWTHAAAASIRNGLDTTGFAEKIEVVYPAITPLKVKKQHHDGSHLLFVSLRFFTKGGKELLEAVDRLGKKYDLSLTVVSDVPDVLQQKYAGKNVTFIAPVLSRETLLATHFSQADIFVLPSYMDTFGMVFLEAMSMGIPVVSTNVFAIPEILGDAGLTVDVSRYSWYGKDYLFAWNSWERFADSVTRTEKPEVVSALAGSISTLIEDKALRQRMGRAGRREVAEGRFSIGQRNSQLKRIYEEAVKA